MKAARTAKLLLIFLALAWLGQFAGAATPGFALRFDGADDYVMVSHSAELNAYPLTITAWVKTLHNANLYEAIVNKYLPGSGNGYSLHMVNGRLYAWYFRDWGDFVYAGDLALDGGFIADGHWHHIAFVVDAAAGALYVDGNLRNSLGWTGVAGAPTANTDILIGKYSLTGAPHTNTFLGEIDEITLWNRALMAGELNYLKHRRHSGTEDGLLAYWRFNDGSGATAANTVGSAHAGTLHNGPQWVASHAAIALQPVATNCLKFDGVGGYVQVAHNVSLNAYPLTASAWFRTSNGGAPLIQGIVSKYRDGSGNGWFLVVQNGRLRGYYSQSFGNPAMDIASPASVADGGWHHAAMVVDSSGGKLFLDGIAIGNNLWASTPGPPSEAEPLQIGRYYNIAGHRFDGALDEVNVWNRALTTEEVQSLRNRPLSGSETGLVGYWRLDEGAGATTADAAGHGHTGSLISDPAWVGSTAYLGDGSVHVVASPGIPWFLQQYAINTAPSRNSFSVIVQAFVRRFHDFGPAPAAAAITTRFAGGLQVAGGGPAVQVVPNAILSNLSMDAYNASAPQPLFFSGATSISSLLGIRPEAGVQLDSVNNLHEAVVTLSHAVNGGAFIEDGTDTTGPARLLHFNGRLFFGDIETTITDIANTPAPSAFFAPAYLQTQLQFPLGGAHIAAQPAFTFGGGAAFNVHLGADGIATNVSGVFSLNTPGPLEASGIQYWPGGITLSSIGATAGSLLLYLPTGFGYSWSEDNRVLKGHFEDFGVGSKLDGTLKPISNVVFAATQKGRAFFYFAEESKPFWIAAPQVEWRVAQGELYIAEAAAVRFARQIEDDDLALQRPILVEPLAADRISNDGFYDGISRVTGEPIYVRPDTNGAALLTMRAALQPSEFRPHFPYMNRNVGGHIPAQGGSLVIANDLIDTASSFLTVAGPVPVPYGRDCGPEAFCATLPTVGPEVLNFTPQSSRLNFTPDGGLMAYGSIPPTNLTWGYIGGTNYSQRTSNVETGAYHVPGTFLRGDQTTVDDAQRPAVLLFTGRGLETNSPYLERPDAPGYGDGFANYAGLNFRGPAEGRSFIAGQDTGSYALTPRGKYYVRYSGVSGIHEAVNFRTNLNIYGYPFNFLSYRLSFLDSDNWESRTDGATSLPYPSDFPVEFERMKFLCRGSLDSAQMPAGVGPKHMSYWKTDIQPFSIQFKPPLNDPCSLSNRFLVLGVETKLPFIPQALHAALGFKPNGNLVTAGDAVAGVTSRFPLPANLELQGPGETKYALTTAAEGYFNNWEQRTAIIGGASSMSPASGPVPRPEGFYNIVATLDVPFFRDIKVHLHVTPLVNASQLNLMGGWPAEAGVGENRGWRIGNGDYFNTSKFDLLHYGWPEETSTEEYRTSSSEAFRPRAQREWLDIITFDYPLAWNPVLRNFVGFVDKTVELPVLDVNSRLKELGPTNVNLDFSQDVDLDLPRIKLLGIDFAFHAPAAFNNPFNSLSNVIRTELDGELQDAGFRKLQNALREDAEPFFRAILEPFLDNVAGNLANTLSNTLAATGKPNMLETTVNTLANDTSLRTAIMVMNDAANQQKTVFSELEETLRGVEDTIGLLIRVLEKKVEGGETNRHIIRTLTKKLIEDQGYGQLYPDFADALINDLLADYYEPTIAEIEARLRELHGQFQQLRGQLGAGTHDFKAALNAANHNEGTLQIYFQQAGLAVSNLLQSAVGPERDYFTADPERARREIRERLIIAFLGSPIDAKYQETLRQYLHDKNVLLTELLNVLFDQINRLIREALSDQFTFARDNRFVNMKGGGLLNESVFAARIRGTPTFQGDSLRLIHLDADVKMKLPDDMTFKAYMDIKELNSQSAPISCIPGGTSAAEVTLAARGVPLDWAGVPSREEGGKPMVVDADARWTFQGPEATVRGIGGSFVIKGKAGFKGHDVNYIGASLALGETETYLAGKASAELKVPIVPTPATLKAKFRGGIFAGKACNIEPLKFVDKEVEQVLTTATDFRGVYLEFGGGLSLADALKFDTPDGVPGCLLDIKAEITTALFYKDGPRFGTIGGRQKIKGTIELLCLLNFDLAWGAYITLDTAGQLTVGGSAKSCFKLGYCPLCAKACAQLDLRGIIREGEITYHVRLHNPAFKD